MPEEIQEQPSVYKFISSEAIKFCCTSGNCGSDHGPFVIGVVSKGMQADQTVVFPLLGHAFPTIRDDDVINRYLSVSDHQKTRNITTQVYNVIGGINKTHWRRPTQIIVDTTYPGIKVFEELNEFSYCEIKGFQPDTIINHSYYPNLRSIMYDILKEKIENHQIKLPRDDKLMEELEALTCDLNKKDLTRVIVDSKDEFKKKSGLNRYPDRADALALTQLADYQLY